MRRLMVSWLMLALSVGVVTAQESVMMTGMGSEVTGTGTESVHVLPNELRLTVALRTEKETLEKALAAYTTRKETVAKLLKDAGALPESVKIGDPKLEGLPNDQAAMLRRAMARMKSEPAKAEAGGGMKAITFAAEATWKLSATSVEELLPEAAAIEGKVRKLDLLGKDAMTAEELETLEESAGQEEQFRYEQPKAQPGEPTFVYAKKLEATQLATMRKAAYQKAVEAAREVAAAAGKDLGDLSSLSAMALPGNLEGDNSSENVFFRRLLQAPEKMGEALAMEAGKVSLQVRVTAGFKLK